MQVITKLHSILKPFLLRRVKSDVENSLPGKKELILYAEMTQQQRDFNEELRQNTLNVSAARCDGPGISLALHWASWSWLLVTSCMSMSMPQTSTACTICTCCASCLVYMKTQLRETRWSSSSRHRHASTPSRLLLATDAILGLFGNQCCSTGA